MQTAYDLVWLSAERTPNELALIDDVSDRKLTYSELISEVDIVANGIRQRGVQQGDLVATILPSLFEHCILLLALQRLCAVPVLINHRLTPGDARDLIHDSGVKAVVIMSDSTFLKELKGVLPEDGFIITVGGKLRGAENYKDCRGNAVNAKFPRPKSDDLAFIFYTSGTTGSPKGVVLTHKTSEHRVIWLCTQAGMRHGTHNRALGFMPLSHVIGFYGVFLVTLALNGSYYVMSKFDPDAAINIIEKQKITYMFAVPQLFFSLTQASNYKPKNMRSLDLVLYGGAAIDPKFLNRIDKEWPGSIRHIYGTTETMCSLYNPNPVGNHRRLRPGFYSRIRVIQVGGGILDTVEPNQEGELIVDTKADTIFTHYLNLPESTKRKVVDGWYYTGDLCKSFVNGDVDLIGRTDDLIRSGGETVHPEEIEQLLLAHPSVDEVAVIGAPSQKWGEAVTACIVAKRVSLNDLHTMLCDSEIASFKRPKLYWHLDFLPRNAANKILRAELRTMVTKEKYREDNQRWMTVGSGP